MNEAPISVCLTFNNNSSIWPKFRTFHVIYKIRPDGNFGSEKEDMSGKIRTYGSPNKNVTFSRNIVDKHSSFMVEDGDTVTLFDAFIITLVII